MCRADWPIFCLLPLLILLPAHEFAVDQDAVTRQAVQHHLEAVLSVMQSHALRRAEIDWKTFRARVLAEAQQAHTTSDLEGSLRLALALLADDHSVYMTQAGKVIGASTKQCKADVAPFRALPPSGIGYLPVLGFVGEERSAELFAVELQDYIHSRDSKATSRWIIDLRWNRGGNMYPMIAGIGPLLGEGVAGYFLHPGGSRTPWGYERGRAFEGKAHHVEVATPYYPLNREPFVAVLIGGQTSSSGEAVAIAFKRRPRTRFFGTRTCGLSTENEAFHFANGDTLYLTIGVMADREGTRFGGPVEPDETVTDAEQVIPRAVEWLLGMPAATK